MPTIVRQFATGGGALQWPNGAAGSVSWADWDATPRTTRVRIHSVAWFANTPGGGAPPLGAGGRVTLELLHPTDPSARIPLVDAIQGSSTDPERFDLSASILLCPGTLPRAVVGGVLRNFSLLCTSVLLAANTTTTLMVDYDLQPWPDGSPLGGGVL
jgi:hypothetical protein